MTKFESLIKNSQQVGLIDGIELSPTTTSSSTITNNSDLDDVQLQEEIRRQESSGTKQHHHMVMSHRSEVCVITHDMLYKFENPLWLKVTEDEIAAALHKISVGPIYFNLSH